MVRLLRQHNNQRGDIAVYTALVVLGVILSSALVFSLILVRQLRATEDAIESEQAFYLANSGLEQGFYALTKHPATAFTDQIIEIKETDFPGEFIPARSTFRGEAVCTFTAEGCQPCVRIEGTFRDVKRRIELLPGSCPPEIRE